MIHMGREDPARRFPAHRELDQQVAVTISGKVQPRASFYKFLDQAHDALLEQMRGRNGAEL